MSERLVLALVVLCTCTFGALARATLQSPPLSALPHRSHVVTVSDSIEMSVVSTIAGQVATFSPDSKRFLVIAHKGDIAANTVEYSVLLFNTNSVFSGIAAPQRILTMSSPSQPAISDLRWLSNDKLIFLGSQSTSLPQIFSFEISRRKLMRVSNSSGAVVAFDSSGSLPTIAFVALPRVTTFFDRQTARSGLIISSQQPADLLAGSYEGPTELFVQHGRANSKEISLGGNSIRPDVELSPDGRYLIAQEQIPATADAWRKYNIRRDFPLVRYVIIDTRSGSSRLLLDAPALSGGRLVWLSDSDSVVISETYLPRSEVNEGQRDGEPFPFTAEVNVNTGRVTPIARGDADVIRWDQASSTIAIRPRLNRNEYEGPVEFQKSGTEWVQKQSGSEIAAQGHPISIVEEQDMNTPPRIFAIDNATKQKKLLIDLNPQFSSLQLGRVEDIAWKGTDGQDQRGGLYLPVGIVSGRRYPLVIQLEGWDAHEFWIDGPSSAGYAAQELAGRGFVVVQAALPSSKALTSINEGPTAMCAIQGLIDYLDHRGLIDRTRVGLLGWSRTGYHVRYTLTFSKYPIAAAVIADGMDASYFQYLSWVNGDEDAGYTYEQINGGYPPFGSGLESWLKHATGFNLENVRTPVRLIAFRRYSLLNNWEWFAGLRRLGKPVEMIWLPDAEHAPVKPSDRFTAQGGAVDWFLFWLKGEEDGNPAKAEQYSRWRELRKLQKRNQIQRIGD